MKVIFYVMGERRFFRVAFKWLAQTCPQIAEKNLELLPEYGRWDDLIYSLEGTSLQKKAFDIIKHQLALDVQCKTPSLLAKWMPSQNASSKETKRLGYLLAKHLRMTSAQYRKTLSTLRERINVLERLMSTNRWDEIEFDKIPSRAGIIYRNAFARRDILAKKYEAFAKNEKTKVNAETLYPHDIAHRALDWEMQKAAWNDPSRLMLQKYWDNLPDFYNGREENGIAVVDVSSSMIGVPMEAAISLGAYIADKSHGPFANHFITFSSQPELIEFEGIDIVDKFYRCQRADWGMNTDLKAVFDLLLKTAKRNGVRQEDMPSKLYIFSDMQFDHCCVTFNRYTTKQTVDTDLERIEKKWEAEGYKFPQVIFWNLRASGTNIPAIGEGFSYVSGFSPVMIDTILGGRDGYDLMLDKLVRSGRYDAVTA